MAYDTGDGVEQDLLKACQWYKRVGTVLLTSIHT
ncbi:MAG: SEL1-like repeat protein [Deltaproteobacteria bacterium]|nr:SEL1-like repeat protein [Deltaproteobacteria bacterium]